MLLIENPHQTQLTRSSPNKGITEIKLVITVAPHNLICPHGKTYPKKAVPINIKKIIIPLLQVSLNRKENIIILRVIWVKIIKKNKFTPLT